MKISFNKEEEEEEKRRGRTEMGEGSGVVLGSVGNRRMEAHLSRGRGPNAGCGQHTLELPQIIGNRLGRI